MAKAVATPEPPRCPHCGEERLVERVPLESRFFCRVCGRIWRDE
jgi:transposase-like protein